MLIRRSCVLALLALISVGAVGAPNSYTEARMLWESHKDSVEYQTYLSEFVQFNNHFHIDEKDGCYQLSGGKVSLMLVIAHEAGAQYSVVSKVFADVDTPKARCFKKSYGSIQTKTPPFLPFVVQMDMG